MNDISVSDLLEDLFSYESFMSHSKWTYINSIERIFQANKKISNSQYVTCLKMLDELKEDRDSYRGIDHEINEISEDLQKPKPFTQGWTFNAKDYD